jgi:hypothetical protein
MFEFALNPPAPEAVDQFDCMVRAKQDLDWFALLDTAFDHGKPGFAFPPDAVNCFQGAFSLDGLKKIAPVLIPLPLPLATERISALVEHRGNRPMLSFIGATKNFTVAELAEQWQSLHFIYPADGDHYLLRMADTRTLANLSKFLEIEQWQAFHQNIEKWHIIGRRGKSEEIWLEKTDKHPPSKLDVTEKQFAKMVELDEPDTALSVISNLQFNAIPEAMDGYRFYDLVTSLLWKTEQYGISHWGDKVSLIILAIGTNGEMLADTDVDAWMKAKEWEEGKIGTAMEAASCFQRWN